MVDKYKNLIATKFPFSDLGPSKYILGYEIERNRADRTLILHQHGYIKSVLDNANLSWCKSMPTPSDVSVKLTNAKFVLESAANPARKIRSVAQSLVKLQTSIDAALEMLTRDAASGFLQLAPKSLSEDSSPLAFVSTSTIIKCEDVCNVIGELELLLSRALPLLQILPGEYGLVDTLLQCEEERCHILRIASERSAFLRAIKRHQTNSSDSPSGAIPVMREYVLHNPDPANPCQLSARLVPSFEENQIASLVHGSLLMAITKSSPS